MLILIVRKHKLPITLIIICLIGIIGFKDTGIFVKKYVSLQDDGIPREFQKEEVVNVLRETEESYIIGKEGITYEIPMENMIRTTRTTQKYIAKKDTIVFDKPLGNPVKLLLFEEVVQALNFEGDYGLFLTADDVQGYILLDDLTRYVEDNISYGVSKVNKVIKSDKLVYTLIKGETVAIKDFKDNLYTVVDAKGNEYKVNENHIEVRNNRERASRSSNFSRRASSISTIIEAAYGEIGKPYRSAAIGPNGYDCSGLTYSLFLNNLSIKLNRSSRDQVRNGVEISKADLMPGDLVFFRTTGKGIGHVGLYIGDSQMIHASSGRKQVMISSIEEAYYKQRYVSARRIIK